MLNLAKALFRIFLFLSISTGLCAQTDSLLLIDQVEGVKIQPSVNTGYSYLTSDQIATSIVTLSRNDFNKGNIYNPWQLIQGRVPGLSITRVGNNPNADFDVRMRGLSTINSDATPLIVIDGVAGMDINQLDPNDVASITILKDAAAAAIYGTRAATGVVIFNTLKKGSVNGVTDISIGSYVGIDNYVLPNIRNLTANEYIARGGTDYGANTDWIEEVTETAISKAANASVGGAFGNAHFRASANWRSNQGIVEGVENERLNTRLSLGHSLVNGRLRVNASAAVNSSEYSDNASDIFTYAMIYNPTAPVYAYDRLVEVGPYFQQDLYDFYNPIALRDQQLFGGKREDLLVSFRGEFDLLHNLTTSLVYTQNSASSLYGQFYSLKDFQIGSFSQGIAKRTTDDQRNEVFTGTLRYIEQLNAQIGVQALVGVERQVRGNEGFGAEVRQFLFDANTWNNLGAGAIRDGANTDVYSYKSEDVLNSVFARVNLNFNDTYYLGATLRSDAYSGFGANNKTGYFPSISAAIELTNLFDLSNTDQLKLRVSYGVNGGLPDRPDLSLGLYENGPRKDLDLDPNTTDDVIVEPVQTTNPNPELKWEERREFNLGLDFSFANSKLTGSLDIYNRTIKDGIGRLVMPIGTPNEFIPGQFNSASATWANIFDFKSGGFEAMISYNKAQLGPVQLTTSINFTAYQETRIESMKTENGTGYDFIRSGYRFVGSSSPPLIEHREGQAFGNIWGPRFVGLDDNGNAIHEPANTTNTDEYSIIGNALPKGQLGWYNQFELKHWTLSFFFRGTFGHDLVNTFRNLYENEHQFSNTWNSIVTDKDLGLTSAPVFSDLYVEDASYLRLDNLQLAYDFHLDNEWMPKLKLYFAAQNLFTITNYAGVDPEVRWYNAWPSPNLREDTLAPGIERRSTYFPSRTFLIGFEIGLK